MRVWRKDGEITYGDGAADFLVHDIWIGDLIQLSPEDMGSQDTIFVAPSEMVVIAAEFDRPGEYVWHCHILSHEDHEMMRPFEVVDGDDNPPGPSAMGEPVSAERNYGLWKSGFFQSDASDYLFG